MSSSTSNPVYKIFELETRLSKFCMFKYRVWEEVGDNADPKSYVQLSISERVHRIGLWMEDRFNVTVKPSCWP